MDTNIPMRYDTGNSFQNPVETQQQARHDAERFIAMRQAFIPNAQPAEAVVEPREGAFDHPAAGDEGAIHQVKSVPVLFC